ncbi:MAG TPA: T9SS type A sorting domain-containing protein [Bacteroidia bacterium]
MKKTFHLSLFCLTFFLQSISAQNIIDRKLFGQNAWYVDIMKIGNPDELDLYWTDLRASGVTTVRIGGITPNWEFGQLTTSTYQRLKYLLKKIRQNGMEPIVQVGYDPSNAVSPQASSIGVVVSDLNSDSDYDYHVYHWIIANEPDHDVNGHDGGYGWKTTAQADLIENYIREYSIAMRNSSPTPIKIIGPELSTYWSTYAVYTALTDMNSTYPSSNATCILPYIDVFTIHLYPFQDQNKPQTAPDQLAATRSNVINYLSGSAPVYFVGGGSTTPLRTQLSDIRTRLNNNGGTNIEIGITETNICTANDVSNSNSTVGSDDLISGTGANSFLAGQFWVETIAECMRANNPSTTNAKVKFLNFWSVKEGSSGDNYAGNIGYLNQDATPGSTWGAAGSKKSTYYHFQMMANNFKGEFLSPAISGSNSSNIKAYAASDGNRIAVMILNQQDGSNPSRSLTVSLNGGGSGSDINLNLGLGLSPSPSNYVTNNSTSYLLNIANQSTVLLLFDCKGNFSGRYDYKMSSATSAPAYVAASPANPLFTPSIALISSPGYLMSGASGTFTLTPGYNYTWTAPGPIVYNNPPSNSSVELSAPTVGGDSYQYLFSVTDGECVFSSGITTYAGGPVVGTPSIFCGYIADIKPAKCNNANGEVTIISYNCTGPTIYYTWDGGTPTTSNPITNLSPGMHTVVVSSSLCGSSYTLQAYVPNSTTAPYVTAGPDKVICLGNNTTLGSAINGGQHPYTYSWSPSTGLSSTTAAKPVATPTVTTTYTVTVTGNGTGACSATDQVTVTVNQPISFTVTGSNTSCIGATTYSVSAVQTGVNYTWSISGGSSGTGSSFTADIASTGATVTFTGSYPNGGCANVTKTLYVGSCCSPSPSAGNFTNSNCTAIAAAGVGSSSGGTLTITGQTIGLNGTLTLDQNLILQGCELRMGYMAKINVAAGKTLTITNNGSNKTHIYACSEMWDGIYDTTSTSAVVINNGSTIEDAVNAVYSKNNGLVNIYSSATYGNVFFNKNLRSLTVLSSTGTYAGYIRATTIKCADGLTGGNPTNTSGKLRYPNTTVRSSTAITLTNVNDITIGNSAVSGDLNTIDNQDFGIVSTNSSIKVYNNNFTNITSTMAGRSDCNAGTAICATAAGNSRTLSAGGTSSATQANTFTNCSVGINAYNGMNCNIISNAFTTVNTGIYVWNNSYRYATITDNVINSSLTGISCYNNVGTNISMTANEIDAGTQVRAIGITVNEVVSGATYQASGNIIENVRHGVIGNGISNSSFDNNNVSIKHTSSASYYCSGIGLTNSTACSVIDNFVQGQNSNDYWVNGIFIDNSTSNEVTCNESHTLGAGMFFGGVQTPNTYIARNLMDNNYWGLVLNYGEVGPQKTMSGATTLPNDNRWTNSFTSGCYVLSYNSNGALSPFYVRPTLVTYNPAVVSGNNCVTSGTAITFTTTSGTNPYECASDGERLSQPGANPNTAYREMEIPVDYDHLVRIAKDSIVPFAYEESTREMLRQGLYQFLMADSTAMANEPILESFVNDKSEGNVGTLDLIQNTLADSAGREASSLTDLLTLNNSIVPENDVQANSQWIYANVMESLTAGNEYSESQLNDMRLMAAKCPYSDGYAVYQARAILSHYDTTEFRNECENIYFGSERAMSAPEAISDFRLFPNPNNGTMNFEYSMNENSEGIFEIFDLSGKLVTAISLSAGEEKQIVIDENQLNSGIYFYKVKINGELKTSNKLVIIK